MEDSKRIALINLATQDIFLRYPRFDIRINNNENEVKINLATFVKDKKSNLLMYAMESITFPKPFDFEDLVRLKNRFLSMCKLNEDKYIFNKDTAIQDPYEINNL